MRSLIQLFIIMSVAIYIGFIYTHEHHHQGPDFIDPRVNPILQRFEYEAMLRDHSVNRSHLIIDFSFTRRPSWLPFLPPDEGVGECQTSKQGAYISIYLPFWLQADGSMKENIVFHELGHCLIGREHCVKKNHGNPISIMYPHVLTSEFYKKNREELVDELFNRSPKCVGNDGNSNEINGSLRPQ